RHSALLAAVDGALLVRGLVPDGAEPAATGLRGAEAAREVARRSFVPADLAQVRARRRVGRGIAAQRGEAVVGRAQLGAAYARDQRVGRRRRGGEDPGLAVARRLRRALVACGGEEGDPLA